MNGMRGTRVTAVCKVPSSVTTAQDFLDWWLVSFQYPNRLSVALRWLASKKGQNIWGSLLSHSMISTVQAMYIADKRCASADMRELALLADWVVAQQMAFLRTGYRSRDVLAQVGID